MTKHKRPAGQHSAPVWPTLEEQLADAKAIPGSALEKLIKDNQEVDLLHPAEANDRWKLPPWIRVYFRKKHPEFKPDGPQVGYPLSLKELYSWLLTHQDAVLSDNRAVK